MFEHSKRKCSNTENSNTEILKKSNNANTHSSWSTDGSVIRTSTSSESISAAFPGRIATRRGGSCCRAFAPAAVACKARMAARRARPLGISVTSIRRRHRGWMRALASLVREESSSGQPQTSTTCPLVRCAFVRWVGGAGRRGG